MRVGREAEGRAEERRRKSSGGARPKEVG